MISFPKLFSFHDPREASLGKVFMREVCAGVWHLQYNRESTNRTEFRRFVPKKALSVVDLKNQAWIDEVLALTWDEFWEDPHKGINQFTHEKISEPKTGVRMLKAFDRSPHIFRALLVEIKQQLDPTRMEDVVEEAQEVQPHDGADG